MYSIKPWGKAALIGASTSAYTLGVGMRWRETVTMLQERRPNPDYELGLHRRCVISQNGIRLLKDLGVTENNIFRELRPAKGWRFINAHLETMREGESYPGCAPSESVYHISHGQLMRTLRREFQRFGGEVSWGTTADDPYASSDVEGFWALNRDYGTIHELECIVVSTDKHEATNEILFGRDELQAIPKIRFDVSSGCARGKGNIPDDVMNLFGRQIDYIIVLGKGFVLHMWQPGNVPTSASAAFEPDFVAWRLVQHPHTAEKASELGMAASVKGGEEAMHPALRKMLAGSTAVSHDTLVLPSRPCPLQSEAQQARLTVIGRALYPVDPFEFRGDAALVDIEDSAALCRRLYSQKYHRGFAPLDMREHEMHCMAKRAQLLQRDLHDAETFLTALAELPPDADGAEPTRPIDDDAAAGKKQRDAESEGDRARVPE